MLWRFYLINRPTLFPLLNANCSPNLVSDSLITAISLCIQATTSNIKLVNSFYQYSFPDHIFLWRIANYWKLLKVFIKFICINILHARGININAQLANRSFVLINSQVKQYKRRVKTKSKNNFDFHILIGGEYLHINGLDVLL